jgi:CheY-like chemotaxis protein
MPAKQLTGLSLLIVEDEPLLVMMLEDFSEELGCKIAAVATNLSEGMAKAESVTFDVAVLDINLKGELVWPLADRLSQAGKPFVVASGGDPRSLQQRYPTAAILAKPYDLDTLQRALQRVVA